MLFTSFTLWSAIAVIALALPQADPPTRVLVDRQASSASPVPDGACTNSPNTRQCWSNGYSISTDFDAKSPPDGTTVTVSLHMQALYAAVAKSGIVQLRNIELCYSKSRWQRWKSTCDVG
jgi:hypothetical protein